MPTEILPQVNRFRMLTGALIVGVCVSVGMFVAFLSLDMQKIRQEVRVLAEFSGVNIQQRLHDSLAIFTSESNFLESAGVTNKGEIEERLARALGDPSLVSVFEQICLLGPARGQLQVQMNPDQPCDVPNPAILGEDNVFPTRAGLTGHLVHPEKQPDVDGAGSSIFVLSMGGGHVATFSMSIEALLTLHRHREGSLEGSLRSCLYVVQQGAARYIGCAGATGNWNAGIIYDPSDAAAFENSSDLSAARNFWVFGTEYRVVVVANPSVIATALSLYPFAMLLFFLLATAGVCWFIYSSTAKNLTLNRQKKLLMTTLQELEVRADDLEQFAYMAAHDLQTPVRHIISRSTMLQEDIDSGDIPAARHNAQLIIDASNRMAAFIMDLLVFCRATQEELSVSKVNVEELIEMQLTVLRDAYDLENVDVHTGSFPEIETDALKLSHVLQNLLTNALKFKRDGVRLSIEIGSQWDDKLKLWAFHVRDNGIGMAKEHLERIFLPFKRLDGASSTAGTGVGLAIVRKNIERLGGKIWVDSAEGQGTTFWFTLPKVCEVVSEEQELLEID